MNWREGAIDRLIEQGLLPPEVKDEIPMSEEQKYNVAMDAMCAAIRAAIFAARDAGISVDAMREEAESALFNALDDAGDPAIGA